MRRRQGESDDAQPSLEPTRSGGPARPSAPTPSEDLDRAGAPTPSGDPDRPPAPTEPEAGEPAEVVGGGHEGRRVALSDLYRSRFDGMVRLATLLVDDPGTAEELVQDAFVHLDTHWDRVTDPSARPAYLRATVVNLSRSRLRRRRVARRLRLARPPDALAAEHHAMLGEDQRAVLAALASLSERQRACVVLRYYEDLAGPAIAETLGISAGSVKTHLHRGMAALAIALEDHS